MIPDLKAGEEFDLKQAVAIIRGVWGDQAAVVRLTGTLFGYIARVAHDVGYMRDLAALLAETGEAASGLQDLTTHIRGDLQIRGDALGQCEELRHELWRAVEALGVVRRHLSAATGLTAAVQSGSESR